MKKYVVISHTHWDREWYLPLSSFRLKLADLIDRLLCLFERDPGYIFHLDAQTVVLEDYLEIRPGKEEVLKKYISSGNLRVGPWYLQNDFYLTDGEVTVRNLLVGTALAEKFGRCDFVGYAPDQFGNISQLPQILAEFGIGNFVFGRGAKFYEGEGEARQEKRTPAEFLWEGADGTRLLAVCLCCWYNNAQHIPAELPLAELLLSVNEKNFEGRNLSPYILLMNGVDHLEPQGDLNGILAALRARGWDIAQDSLQHYLAELSRFAEGKELPVLRGALNHGGDYDLLRGCWSSRIYLKRDNVRAQDLLLGKLEPLYAYLEGNGLSGSYPAGTLGYLWKELLKNLPHDSICGCARDEVHRHMEDSYERIFEMGEDLEGRGMKLLAAHISPCVRPEEYSVTLFNGTELAMGGVAEAVLDFPLSEHISEFSLIGPNGAVPYETVSRTRIPLDVISPLNLPGILDVERVRIRFCAEEVPPYGALQYLVVPHRAGLHPAEHEPFAGARYALSMSEGRLYLTDRAEGKRYADPILLEDCADKGDAYVFRRAEEEPLLLRPVLEKIEAGALRTKVYGAFRYACPACYDFEEDRRSPEKVENVLTFCLTVDAGSDVIALDYEIANAARDHRMRLLFEGGLQGKLVTDSPFDCDVRLPMESCDVTDSDTHHNTSFAEQEAGERAFAVFTEGQYEVEPLGSRLAFTVLRATGCINRDAKTFRAVGGSCWQVPENQCLRTVCGRFGLLFGKTRPRAVLFAMAKQFRYGLAVHGDSCDPKKYAGGRFAVQKAELEKLYYVEDPYAGRTAARPLFETEGDMVAVSCVKAGEKGGIAVRFFNPSEEDVTFAIKARGSIYRTTMSEDEDIFVQDDRAEFTLAPKKILTVKIGAYRSARAWNGRGPC